VVRVEHDDRHGPLIQTSVSGTLVPLDAPSVRRALWRYPAMTLGVVLHIHWQALKLFLKRTPFFGKPLAPAQFTSR